MRGANDIKTTRARRLRADHTDAEAKLWWRLRSRQIGNSKFVRQEPIGPYVCDFVCREHRLVIEVDGGQHNESASDKARDAWLRARDYRVIRFWNNDVLSNIDGVLIAIAEAIETPPHPAQR